MHLKYPFHHFSNPLLERPNKRRMGNFKILKQLFFIIGFFFLVSTCVVTFATSSSSSAELLKKNFLANANKLIGKQEVFADDICLTKACIDSAEEITNNLDIRRDPCENFYLFACGGFVNKTEIPNDKTIVTSITKLKEKLDNQLRQLVEAPIQNSEAKPFQLVKKLYQSCIDTDKIDRDGLRPLRRIIERIGGWPVLGNWSPPNGFSWAETVFRIKEQGFSVDYLIDFSVITDLKEARRIISLDRGELGLKREYLLKGSGGKEVQAYHKMQVDLAVYLGANKETAAEEMLKVLEFEKALANVSSSLEERRNETNFYNPMTIRTLQSRFPFVNWINYINRILPNNIKVGEYEVVTVAEPYYLFQLGQILSRINHRVVQNYLVLRLVEDSANYLDEGMRNIQLEYLKSLTGVVSQTPRWKECVKIMTSSLLANAIGVLYIRNHFDEAAKAAAWDILTNIHTTFLRTLNDTTWMDPITKGRAYKKATSMSADVGYPDELLNIRLVSNLYAGLEFNEDSFLENTLNLLKLMTKYSFYSLRQQFNESLSWVSVGRPAVINAFYDRLGNSMNFPAGILQGTIFDKDRPNYLNFGAFGWVCGHEIVHGYDDRGRQFDGDGNLNNWWGESTEISFISKADCIIQQYNEFKVPGTNIHLNGYNTQGENIADLGGIKESYKAYQSFVRLNGPEKRLPNLNYNANQLFWISAANIYCNKIRPEAIEQEVLLGAHSPGEFRVNGAFSNLDEFAREFNCPVGSKMNRGAQKCVIW